MSSNSGRRGTTSFDSIEREVAALSVKKRMGDAFERVVLHYLRSAGSGFTRVSSWNDWPDRLRLGLKSDQGVDLVGIDGEGKRVAIQVKFHTDPERDVTQREVATLFSLRPDLFDRWFIVSNAIGHSPAAERATQGRGDVTWVQRDDLAASPIDWSGALEAVSGRARLRVEPASPRDPEQTAAIADVVETLKTAERAQLVMACGTGKTLVTRWITEARKDRLVLVLVPTLLLLKQFRTSWREQARSDFIDLGVCSDADTMGRDEWTVHPDELGVRVTTAPADIATFLKGEGRRVVFGTYASSARIAEAQEDPSVPAFDLVIADEAHRVAGISTKGNASERDTRIVLEGDRIRSDRRLFATATPRVYGPTARGRLTEREDIEFASMDDPEHFGVEAHKLWFREAVELGRLVDYRLSVVIVTDAEVRGLIREREMVDVQGKTFDAETLASIIALRRAAADLGLTRAISFHSTIKRARDFARELERLELDAPPVAAQHISGAMSMADRQRVLARLREPEGPTIVTNARCLTEGIDVPNLDAVAFVDPRSSAVDIVQAVGRVMRTAPGKQFGHVIVPVFLSEDSLADPEEATESSAFEPVLAVLRALRAHDPELISDATRIATSLGERVVSAGHISEHIQLLGQAIDVAAFESALEMRFVEVSVDRWEVGLGHLRAFVAREGRAWVPMSHVEGGFGLGVWLAARRADYVAGRLRPDRAQVLETLPGWSWAAPDARWSEAMQLMRRYVVREGTAAISGSQVEDGFHLGKWASQKRSEYRRGRLDEARIRELEDLRGWTWDPIEDEWSAAITALDSFARREGHTRVPGSHVEVGFALGKWATLRRTRYRAGTLEAAQIAALEGFPGWTWDPRQADWDAHMAALGDFAGREGHVSVPPGHLEHGLRLGQWVGLRRASWGQGSLSLDRVAELESLPGWTWTPRDDQWDGYMRALHTYVAREGHAKVPKSHVEGDAQLGQFVSKRRVQHRKGKLAPDRAKALEELPGWTWDRNADEWTATLSTLEAYAAREGHALVPAAHVEAGVPLGKWVSRQRSTYRQGGLASEQVAVLEALRGWSWDPKEDDFKAAMNALETYAHRERNTLVPVEHRESGIALGRWVRSRRSEYASGRLPARSVEALEAVAGWEWVPRRRNQPRAIRGG